MRDLRGCMRDCMSSISAKVEHSEVSTDASNYSELRG